MGNNRNSATKISKDEEMSVKDLFKIYSETKDQEVRDELINRHLYIAEILSKKYANRGIDFDDIYQVACLGLIYAIDRYDISKGYEFSSFATPTIIGEIKKYFRDKGWSIRVPRRIQELSKKINNAKLLLSQKLQKTPTVQDIAEYLNSTEEEVLEAMEASKVYTPHSLDASLDSDSDDKDVSLAALIGQEDEYLLRVENRDFLLDTINKLNEIEKKIIKDRYFNRKTQIAIAEDIGMSQMTVSRLEKKIIEKFRKELKKIYNE
ncbi:SigB/SigF/SigG family RNA polymerase sigma factor [Clostridium sp. D2Q-11]|uniref:SigB/SigF/SigG family RNA polymerase sigma factor n=1 Tax=Anaeromonas frigoriresistens TaxID=2683708 RepID=A0A942UVF6_9FIRM|nr:SigB/SigF/SigG family RNA polymerase sigma factor [Anaeromonas frigoriresistens]MBS4539323.1 SigB/SigF/SigG family RNA polymerase sigma factor [Anaeromonas frigoriresistens]